MSKPIQAPQLLPPYLSFLNPHVIDDLTRFGNRGDGGYVLPGSAVERIDAVLSFGLANDWSLESALAATKPGRKIHAYDHTVSPALFRRSLQKGVIGFLAGRMSVADLRARYRLDRDYRRFFTANHVHFRERIFNRQEESIDATIDIAVARLGDAKHVFLKMDIEGDEYRVLPQVLLFSDRIDLMTVEFHNTEPLRPVFEAQVKAALQHFAIVHLHGNNYIGMAADGLPDTLEITFLNRRYPVSEMRRDRLPLPGLDLPNDPSRPEPAFAFC